MSGERMRLLAFKRVTKGSLRGFASIELPIGLRILDCPVHLGVNGRTWAALPAKPAIDNDGRQLRADRGKGRWSPVLEWSSERLRQAFSARIIALVEEHDPGALQ